MDTLESENLKQKGFLDQPWRGGKSRWEWLDLVAKLAVPVILGLATLTFSIQQANIAQQQHDADQPRATEQQQAAILQTYIDNIQDLLLNHKLGDAPPLTPRSPQATEVQILASARTLTALQGLDPQRKRILLDFLSSARLIGFNVNRVQKVGAIIDLSDADLSEVDLHGGLSGAQLAYTNLSNAKLSNGYFFNTDFFGANFSGANFSGAFLWGADLSDAHNLTQQQLDQVLSCFGTNLPKGLTCHHNCNPDQPDPICAQGLQQLQE